MSIRPASFVALLIGLSLVAADARADIEWQEVKSADGTVKSTIKKKGGGNNRNRNRNRNRTGPDSNYRVRPVRIPFSLDSPGMRIKFETSGAGDRPLLTIELEIQIESPNGDKRWQRVQVVGRTRGDAKGGLDLNAAPGKYRFSLTGQNTKYSITVQTPVRSE